jgi:hypothetical protein
MIKSIAKHAMATATVIALGGTGAASAQESARASVFSAAYNCTVPVLGSRPIVINGTLTAMANRVIVGQPIRFQLHIARLSLQTPVAIESWTAVAGIDVNGAQATSFRMAGTGGPVAPRQPISGDLYGTWVPRARGVDRFRGGTVSISARIARIGVLTATCLPVTPRPVLETVTALPHHVLRARYIGADA